MTEPLAPALGVVIPYYGGEDLLRVAVDSVLAQHDPRWTLDVVVDGPDQPPVETWLEALDDPRVRWHRNPANLGVAGNFQRCLDLADASYVTFLGCDDVLRPTYVSSVRAALAVFTSAAVVQPGVEVVDATGRRHDPFTDRVKRRLSPRPGVPTALGGQRLLVTLMRGNWTYFPSLCWRRDRIAAIGFRPDLPVTLDLALLARVVLDGGEVVVTPETAFSYRRHAGSVSARSARAVDRFDEEARLYRELALACDERGWPRAARAARWRATSRLHAVMELAGSARRRDARASRRLARLVVTR